MRAAGRKHRWQPAAACPAHTSALSLHCTAGPHAPAGTCVLLLEDFLLLRSLLSCPAAGSALVSCLQQLPINDLGYRPPSSLSPWWDHSEASVLCESQSSCRGIRLPIAHGGSWFENARVTARPPCLTSPTTTPYAFACMCVRVLGLLQGEPQRVL